MKMYRLLCLSRLNDDGMFETLESGSSASGNAVDVKVALKGKSALNLICYRNDEVIAMAPVTVPIDLAQVSLVGSKSLLLSYTQNGIHYDNLLMAFPFAEDRDKARQEICDLLDACNASGTEDSKKNPDQSECRSNELMLLNKKKKTVDISSFDQRTDDASATQYFQFYAYLAQQQNMMQDYIRTSTYQRAILDNYSDFQNKVVLDVGTGSGILSFFAVQAGARHVYAVDASAIASHASALVRDNGFEDRITVKQRFCYPINSVATLNERIGTGMQKFCILAGKIEELDLPEKVDVIISEPMGYMLFNERMLETYLHAKKWLKVEDVSAAAATTGKMFPTKGILFITPFTDEALYMEQMSKCNFWSQTSFYSVDLSSLKQDAIQEYFQQPIVDTFDPRVCLCKPTQYCVNFLTASEFDLHDMNIPLEFQPITTAVVHGLAFWFDVLFDGSITPVWLSTSPTQPLTHWYQVRCLLPRPMLVAYNQTIKGFVHFRSNPRQSYDIDIELSIAGTDMISRNTLDLKNPYFRYTGQITPPIPAGNLRECPTDAYFAAANGAAIASYTTMMGAAPSNPDIAMQPASGNLVYDSSVNIEGMHPDAIGALQYQQQQQQQQQQFQLQYGNTSSNLTGSYLPYPLPVQPPAEQPYNNASLFTQQPASSSMDNPLPFSTEILYGSNNPAILTPSTNQNAYAPAHNHLDAGIADQYASTVDTHGSLNCNSIDMEFESILSNNDRAIPAFNPKFQPLLPAFTSGPAKTSSCKCGGYHEQVLPAAENQQEFGCPDSLAMRLGSHEAATIDNQDSNMQGLEYFTNERAQPQLIPRTSAFSRIMDNLAAVNDAEEGGRQGDAVSQARDKTTRATRNTPDTAKYKLESPESKN